MENEQKSTQYLIPSSIIVAGLLIAFAVVYSNGLPGGGNTANVGNFGNEKSPSAKNLRAVDSSDHILGNPDAPVKIVEYSDLECPFCKTFHPTLNKIINDYGNDGKVAWVYRHLPLDSIHSRARKEAEASECAAELGGNNAFWKFIGRVFEVTPSNNRLEPSKLTEIAVELGLNKESFDSCLSSGKHAQKVEKDFRDAVAAGGDGTPYTIIVTSKGEVFPFSGALPYEQVKPILEQALSSI